MSRLDQTVPEKVVGIEQLSPGSFRSLLLDRFHWQWLSRVLGVTVIYLATAKVGFLMAIPPGNVTAVWPPSGIALAVLLIWGPRLSPGIWLGAFLANTWVFKGANVSAVD